MRLPMLRQTLFIGLVTAGLLTALHAADDPGRAAHDAGAQAAPAPKPVHELQIVAGRFAYEPATLQVIAGEPVRLVVRSKDTVHGFSIPKLKIDERVPKGGEPVVIEFIAPLAGRYEIECSEFCGSGHKQMKAALISGAPNVTNQ
jgi:heme/copper-type cytochrome/quinol oxidase subunit 2